MTAGFSDKTWEERRKQLGKEAEAAFSRFAKTKSFQYDRYGFDDSTITTKFGKLPDMIRYTPDFVCVGRDPFLVECKGMGSKGYVQIKDMTIPGLLQWNELCPVFFFIWDSYRKEASFTRFTDLTSLIDGGQCTISQFVDGPVVKKVYQIWKKDLQWMTGEQRFG